MSGDTSDEFQNELVELFVQEAHEWLQNIHVALDEIQQGPPPERHAVLINTLTAGYFCIQIVFLGYFPYYDQFIRRDLSTGNTRHY